MCVLFSIALTYFYDDKFFNIFYEIRHKSYFFLKDISHMHKTYKSYTKPHKSFFCCVLVGFNVVHKNLNK